MVAEAVVAAAMAAARTEAAEMADKVGTAAVEAAYAVETEAP